MGDEFRLRTHDGWIATICLRRGLQADGRHQIDLEAVERGPDGGDRIHAIGEVKAGKEAVGLAQLDRLDQMVRKLGRRIAPRVQRLLIARSGFTIQLQRSAATRDDVQLVDLHRLYSGD